MDTYGKWTVLSTFKKSQRTFALAQCECGVEKEIALTNLKRGLTTQCSACRYRNRGPNFNARRTGTLSAAKIAYGTYKTSAKSRGYDFQLTLDEFIDITARNCFFCDGEPSNTVKAPKEWAEDFIYNGIDRFDNGLGYVYSNCVACCKHCNYSKRDLTAEQFIENCVRVADRYAANKLTRKE